MRARQPATLSQPQLIATVRHPKSTWNGMATWCVEDSCFTQLNAKSHDIWSIGSSLWRQGPLTSWRILQNFQHLQEQQQRQAGRRQAWPKQRWDEDLGALQMVAYRARSTRPFGRPWKRDLVHCGDRQEGLLPPAMGHEVQSSHEHSWPWPTSPLAWGSFCLARAHEVEERPEVWSTCSWGSFGHAFFLGFLTRKRPCMDLLQQRFQGGSLRSWPGHTGTHSAAERTWIVRWGNKGPVSVPTPVQRLCSGTLYWQFLQRDGRECFRWFRQKSLRWNAWGLASHAEAMPVFLRNPGDKQRAALRATREVPAVSRPVLPVTAALRGRYFGVFTDWLHAGSPCRMYRGNKSGLGSFWKGFIPCW